LILSPKDVFEISNLFRIAAQTGRQGRRRYRLERANVLLIGIDEAGYGPVIGPLCHGFCAFRVPESDDYSPPDFWKLLHPEIAPFDGCVENVSILIDDSKIVYTRRGFSALEAGVRAFLECMKPPLSDAPLQSGFVGLNELLHEDEHAVLRGDKWFCEPCAPPVTDAPIVGNLRQKLAQQQASIVALGARAMSPRVYNEALDSGLNKSEVSWRPIAAEIKRLAALAAPDECIHVTVDRQGGRRFYAAHIAELFGVPLVRTTREEELISHYVIDGERRQVHVGFFVGGENVHMPIALASMVAKLAREKCMQRLNAFFLRHQPELKPTAGYYGDGRRFLKDTRKLRRRLKIKDGDFIRKK